MYRTPECDCPSTEIDKLLLLTMITTKHSSRMRTARFCAWGRGGRVYLQIPYPVADLRGALGMHAPGSKFLQFHAVSGNILQNHKLAPPRKVGAPTSEKSWIHHCYPLDTLPPGYPTSPDTLPSRKDMRPEIPYPTPQKEHGTRDTLPPSHVNRLIDACENIIFPQQQLNLMTILLQLRMVGIKQKNLDLPLAP